MGSRGCSLFPPLDPYFSSSEIVKKIIKENSKNFFSKKILGIYTTQECALRFEVRYHKIVNISQNAVFFNLAKQTSTRFSYDNTGRRQTAESNYGHSP
jgi:hypothetical protein